jgi:hypothetical protein
MLIHLKYSLKKLYVMSFFHANICKHILLLPCARINNTECAIYKHFIIIPHNGTGVYGYKITLSQMYMAQ